MCIDFKSEFHLEDKDEIIFICKIVTQFEKIKCKLFLLLYYRKCELSSASNYFFLGQLQHSVRNYISILDYWTYKTMPSPCVSGRSSF